MNRFSIERVFCVYIMFFCALFLAHKSHAAPIPGTGSSGLVNSKNGLYISKFGFSIHSGKTDWQLIEPPSNIPAITTLYKSPKVQKGVQASLSVRVDRIQQETSVQKYTKQFIKDYSRLGFEVLESRPLKVSGQSAFLIDVLNKETAKQLRQVVLMKEKTVVVLTCRDHQELFDTTVKTCNEIIRNFKWK